MYCRDTAAAVRCLKDMMNKLPLTVLLLSALPLFANAQSTTTILPGMEAPQVSSSVPAAVTPPADRGSSGPWEVAEAAVKGTINLKPKAALKAGKARKGRIYSKDFVAQDIEALLALGSVEKVSVDIEELPNRAVSPKLADVVGSTSPARITYIITERPMIKTITVTGAKGLSKSAVKDEMTLKEKDFFDELKIRAEAGA